MINFNGYHISEKFIEIKPQIISFACNHSFFQLSFHHRMQSTIVTHMQHQILHILQNLQKLGLCIPRTQTSSFPILYMFLHTHLILIIFGIFFAKATMRCYLDFCNIYDTIQQRTHDFMHQYFLYILTFYSQQWLLFEYFFLPYFVFKISQIDSE